MPRHPCFQVPREVGRDGNPGVECLGLCLSDALRPLLFFLDGFVYAQLIGANVFNSESQQLRWA